MENLKKRQSPVERNTQFKIVAAVASAAAAQPEFGGGEISLTLSEGQSDGLSASGEKCVSTLRGLPSPPAGTRGEGAKGGWGGREEKNKCV